MQPSHVQADLVSTIIPVFNRPELIVDSINSVLKQNYRPIEIIVVDDGSTDKTPRVLQSLAATHNELTVLRQENAGPGAARELGRLHARGEFIQYHDSDDLLLPDKFSRQVSALKQNPDCDIAYGKTERVDIGAAVQGIALKQSGIKYKAMFPASLRSRWWSTSTPLYRRSVTDQVGSWLATRNEEDWEYECRVAALGGRLVFVDEFVSLTQSHSSHLTKLGGTDPQLLQNRCVARAAIFKHAKRYCELSDRATEIQAADWQYFSKSVFLLARECAAVGLDSDTLEMIELSIQANQGATLKHRLFSAVGRLLGWKTAAKLVALIGK